MHESHSPVMNILCGPAPLQLGHVIDLLSDPLAREGPSHIGYEETWLL